MSSILETARGSLSRQHRLTSRSTGAGLMALAFLTSLPTGMERGMANSTVTRQPLQVEHVKMETRKKFADVVAALEASVPKLDPAIAEALSNGDEQRATELEGSSQASKWRSRG